MAMRAVWKVVNRGLRGPWHVSTLANPLSTPYQLPSKYVTTQTLLPPNHLYFNSSCLYPLQKATKFKFLTFAFQIQLLIAHIKSYAQNTSL